MFTDNKFTRSSTGIDKRGKKLKKEDSVANNPLKHYYRLDQEEKKKNRKDDELDGDSGTSESEFGGEIEKFNHEIGDLDEDQDVESEGEYAQVKKAEVESSDDGVDEEDTSSTASEVEYYSEEENNLALEENVPENRK